MNRETTSIHDHGCFFVPKVKNEGDIFLIYFFVLYVDNLQFLYYDIKCCHTAV
jgi:hypothetical protein